MSTVTGLSPYNAGAMSVLNAAGDVLYASPSSAKIFGYPPNELVGRNTFDLIHPEEVNYSREAFREVLAKPPGPCQVEARHRQKNGEWCWVEGTIFNLLNEPLVSAIVVNYREINATKSAREQKRERAKELFRSNTEVEHFAYAVAHDLREPLRTVSMFAQLLMRGSQLDTEGKLLAQFVIDGAARMSALFEGLQAFAIHDLDDLPRPSNLGRVVADVLQDLAHAISNSNAIVTVDPLPCVQGNEKHLRRVFQNLILNAIKYRSSAPIEIHVTAEPLAGGWLIKVSDNGIGIAPEHRDDVFGLLKRLHGTEIPGAGIGLSICRKIIEALGGRIWVESELGAGSTLCFTLTAANDDEIVPDPSVEDRNVDRVLGEDVERASNRGMPHRTGLRRACTH